jgi:hypothetical protein
VTGGNTLLVTNRVTGPGQVRKLTIALPASGVTDDLAGVACASAHLCLAVDQTGYAYIVTDTPAPSDGADG